MLARLILFVSAAAMIGCSTSASSVPEYGFKIVHVYPHDPTSFTEGLEYHDGYLYESTGLEGHSVLRKNDLQTGKAVQQINLEDKYFGEGFTVFNGRLIQLTYKTQIGFVYDQAGLRQMRTFSYAGEGWSLTNDGKRIYMDDGTAQIRIWDPNSLDETSRITIHDEDGSPIEHVNELEWVKGEIYANVWMTDEVLRISPKDGRVLGRINLYGLLTSAERAQADVLNGIAYDAGGNRLFVTGKLWPKLFEIELVAK